MIHCLSCEFLSNLNWISKLSTSVWPNISSSDQVQLKKQLQIDLYAMAIKRAYPTTVLKINLGLDWQYIPQRRYKGRAYLYTKRYSGWQYIQDVLDVTDLKRYSGC